MDYFDFGASAERINSKAACDFLAQRLRELANEFESRSIALENTRQNSFFIDDKSPALHVATVMFNGWKKGACPVTICHNMSGRYMVSYEACKQIFERKKNIYKREQIKKRNQRMRKWDYDGVSQTEICKRTGLSKGQVSKIIRNSSHK